ncbi:hypothetical protein FAI40_07270 [Acetobacteraceae bacterium]|nr:hypothetical protein FAI40_07270 [Acetobacteraceae bacterium]
MRPISTFLVGTKALFCAFCLSACSIHHPFANPNLSTQILTQSNLPTPLLAVPVPETARISNHLAADRLTRSLTSALVAQNVPAVSRTPAKGDWWVDLESRSENGSIVIHYAIMGTNNLIQSQGDTDPIDEKFWKNADRELLNTMALQMAPMIANALTEIRSDRMLHDTANIQAPSRIFFNGVEGAPGDGNLLLARSFYAAYPKNGGTLLKNGTGADFIVHTEVNLSNAPPDPQGNSQQQIELIWHVQSTLDKKEVGAATQIHTIPAHSLDDHWGDTAVAAATEAGGAVSQIIANYTGKNQKSLLAPESKILSEPSSKPDPMNTPVEKNY